MRSFTYSINSISDVLDEYGNGCSNDNPTIHTWNDSPFRTRDESYIDGQGNGLWKISIFLNLRTGNFYPGKNFKKRNCSKQLLIKLFKTSILSCAHAQSEMMQKEIYLFEVIIILKCRLLYNGFYFLVLLFICDPF